MSFANFCSWPGEDIPSNMYCPSVTPRPANICVSSVSVNFYKNSISSCGIIFSLLSLVLYLVV